MQKKDGKWFTRKKGAMLVLTLCLVGAAAATTYYAVDLSDTAQEPAKEHMVDLNESPVETEAEAVISSEAEANLASQANEMDVDPKSLAGGNRQIRAEQETAGQETEAETEGMETEKVSSGQVNAVVSPTVSFASTQELQWPVAGKEAHVDLDLLTLASYYSRYRNGSSAAPSFSMAKYRFVPSLQ